MKIQTKSTLSLIPPGIIPGIAILIAASACSGGGRVQLHMKSPDDFNPQTAHPNQIAERINSGKLGLDEGLKLLREKAAQAEISDDPVELVSPTSVDQESSVQSIAKAVANLEKGDFESNMAVVTGVSESSENTRNAPKLKDVSQLIKKNWSELSKQFKHFNAFVIGLLMQHRIQQKYSRQDPDIWANIQDQIRLSKINLYQLVYNELKSQYEFDLAEYEAYDCAVRARSSQIAG